MTLKQQIEQDLKTAMLAGDKTLVMTLRGLKSAILNIEIAKGSREQGLSDTEIIDLLAKEAKKRQESADLYQQGDNLERANAELEEKRVIEHYLPQQLSEDELRAIIDRAVSAMPDASMQQMGQIIGLVKSQTAGSADGAKIAQFVKERLSK